MKFLADMGISLRTVAWLRDAGARCCASARSGFAKATG
jgi:hypothetical protein